MNKDQIEKVKSAKLEFPRITLWEKNGKSRIYVEGCGYLTEDSADVYGNSNGEFMGLYYQYTRPGKAGTLRDAIRAIAMGDD